MPGVMKSSRSTRRLTFRKRTFVLVRLIRDEPRICLELPEIPVSGVLLNTELLEKAEAGRGRDGDALWEPDFVIDPCLDERNARPRVQTDQEQAPGHGIDHLGLQLDPMVSLTIDPKPAANVGKNFRVAAARPVAGVWLSIQDPDRPPFQLFLRGYFEIESLSHFAHVLALAFAALLVLSDPLGAVLGGFSGAVRNTFFQLLPLLCLIGGRQGTIIASNQAEVRRPIEQRDVVGFDLGRFRLAAGIEVPFRGALQKSIVPGHPPVFVAGLDRARHDFSRVRCLSRCEPREYKRERNPHDGLYVHRE